MQYEISAVLESESNKRRASADLASNLKKLIIGGNEAFIGRYPYQVEVFASGDNGDDLVCGGTLIDPEWVLTAAGCFTPTLSKVAIGRHNQTDADETYELIGINFAVIHPNFSPFYVDNDFLMIKLSAPSKTPVITLNANPKLPKDSMNVTAMGWGDIDKESGLNNDVLREIELNVISNIQCSNVYDFESTGVLITNNMLCAVTLTNDEGPCQGDKGGPIIIKGENATMDIQTGIISSGVCADVEKPYICSRVSAGLDFINTVLSCTVPNDTDLSFSECCQVTCENGEFTCIRRGALDVDDCNVDTPCSVGDGVCDDGPLNTAECKYDGGDCCADTCIDNIMPCGLCYFCRNPESSDYSPPFLRDTIDSVVQFFTRITP